MQRSLALLACAFGLTGCLSFHSLQDGRVLDAGESSLIYGASQSQLPSELAPQVTIVPEEPEPESAPISTTHLKYRRGFAGWELGLSVLGAFAYNLDAKWALLSEERGAVSVGAQLGAADYQKTFGASQKARTVQVVLPIYLSYDWSKWFTTYSTPMLGIYSLARDDQDRRTATIGGATFGLHTGDQFRVYVEGFVGRDTTADHEQWIQTATLGISFRPDKKNGPQEDPSSKPLATSD